MSVVTVAEFKAFARVIHTLDDVLILDLIEAAEAEALQYMDRQDLPRRGEDIPPDECDTTLVIDAISEGSDLAPDVRLAICRLVQAAYEATVEEADKLRAAAMTSLAPHRHRLGA